MTVVIERLREGAPGLFAETPVRFAYLFGSWAKGTAGPHSDVDVAVHLDGAPADLDLVLDLIGRLERLCGTTVDLVVLEEASLRLVHRILADRIVLHGDREPARVRYESTMRRVAGDFARHADALDREMLQAVADGRR